MRNRSNTKKHEPTNIAIVLACTYRLLTGFVHTGPALVDRHLHTGPTPVELRHSDIAPVAVVLLLIP